MADDRNEHGRRTRLIPRILWIFLTIAIGLLGFGLTGCRDSAKPLTLQHGTENTPLEEMAVTWGMHEKFDAEFLRAFGERNGIRTQFVPNSRLEVYERLLKAHSGEPDLLEVDIIWPGILADDLVDLRPYLTEVRLKSFPKALLENYTVRGRLVALPISVDVGVLYYRPDLLAKYRFAHPPNTWDELEMMAGRIQTGERRAGNQEFWGYTWQGAAAEAGTCNALEWQSAAGAGNFIESPGTVNVSSSLFVAALRRSQRWIGSISPSAAYVYREDDSVNLWDAGQTAFMRNWASGFGHINKHPGGDQSHFGVLPLPAGANGHRGTLGGLGLAVSKYAANQDLAIKALLEITSEQTDMNLMVKTEEIPTHTALFDRPDVKSRSLLLAVSADLMKSLVSRPALLTGEKYVQVSKEYATAVNSVLRGQATPEAAMAALQTKLVNITGFPAKQDSRLAMGSSALR